jgi:hypothetical protein
MLAALVASAMVASMAIAPVFAATYTYENEANALHTAGLYEGISETEFVPDLGTKLDRETGVTMLLRLFGQEDEALALSEADANAKLAKFTDGGTVSDWAKKQVAYAVDKGFVKGIENKGSFSFQPKAALVGRAYASLILQQLGYDGDFTYNEALTALANAGGLTAVQAVSFDKELIKDDLVGLSYNALQAKYKADGKTVIKVLLENGSVKKEDLDAAKITYAYVVSVEPLADVTVDIGGTPKLPETVKATLDNGTTADVAVTWPTVDTTEVGEKTVTGTIAYTTVTATIKVKVVPAELTVEGKASGNRKEIILNFNRPLEDADKATDVKNYTIKKYGVKNADLSEDKMTVTLLTKELIDQQADVKVTVDKDLGLKDDVDLTIKNVKDTNPPEVSSVEAIGNSLIKVKFSEPVQNARSISYYTIDGKTFAASKTTVSDNEKVVSITLKNPLSVGSHTLVVKDKVIDYTGFAIEDNETEITVVEDKEAPTGEVVSATQTKVVLKFSEPVKEPSKDDVDTNTSAKFDGDPELADDDMTYTIKFKINNPLPAAGCKLTIDNLSDYSGNKVDFSINVEVKYDTEKPEYVSYTVDDNQKKIIIEYNEDVYENGDYELVDADGDDVAIEWEYEKDDDDEYVRNKIVITRADDEAFASEKHKLTISGVEDYTPMKNEIAKTTVTIEIDDQEAPYVEYAVIDYAGDDADDNNALYVLFSEDVDEDSATDFANYSFKLSGKTIFDLDNDFADIELLSDDKTVCITFDRKKDAKDTEGEDYVLAKNITELYVDSVKDTSDNEMKRQTLTKDDEDIVIKSNLKQPTIIEANVTGENTITLKLADGSKINAKTLIADDFIIKAGSKNIEAYDAEYNSNDNEIKLTVNQDLSSDGKYDGNAIILTLEDEDDIDTVDAFEQPLTIDVNEVDSSGYIAVGDKYDPTISSVAEAVYDKNGTRGYGEGNIALIEVSEELAINGSNLVDGDEITGTAATQFSVKVGSDIVDAKIYYFAPEGKDDEDTDVDETKALLAIVVDNSVKDYSGKTISVDFVPFANNDKNKAYIITDKSGNALKEQKEMSDTIVRIKTK